MTSSAGPLLASLSDELAAAVEHAGRSVVTVNARRRLPATGIVWPGGVVVTADHVLEREEDIFVLLPDGQKVAATVAGRDPTSDVAVLRLASQAPDPAELAPADSVKVGHVVLALGRPYRGPSASLGIVSAVGGSWRTAGGGMIEGSIRADLVLYPGFSGGPLIDVHGRVVALNSSFLARGLEVAIPVAAVSTIVETLLAQGHIRRAYLGITSQMVQVPAALRERLALQQETALLVVGVEAGSPADQGGLLVGDLMVALDGESITGIDDLQAALGPARVGKTAVATVLRGGEPAQVSVTLGERELTTFTRPRPRPFRR